MPTTTFEHLAPAKRARITTALLTEFSAHPLADAQVARIVKEADIARGAFYKYFADLTDAYQYLYAIAMTAVHHDVPTAIQAYDATAFYTAVVHFVDHATASRYDALIQRHFTQNEGLLPATQGVSPQIPTSVWAAMVLSHATIKEIMQHPDQRTTSLARLRAALTALVG